ncbi:TAXI family TRAP transporter solute-binding subunit [Bacteroidota bacterium]
MHKIWFNVLLAAVLVVGLVLVGCAKPAPSPAPAPAPTPAPTPAKWPDVISIGTSPTGGTYYVVGVGWADMVSKYVNTTVRAESTGGAEANIRLMESGETELGIVNDMDAYIAPRGLDYYAPKKMPVRLLFKSHKFEMWVATRADSGIKTIEDLRGKKYMCDWKGAPVQISWNKPMLECAGILDEVTILPASGWKEIKAGIAEGTADAVAYIGSHPAPHPTEQAETIGVRMISLSDEMLECINKKIPWAAPNKIPAGTYKGQTEDVGDVMVWTNMTITPDLPDDLVYELAKATFEHLNELVPVHPVFKQLGLKGALTNPQMPYHAGAVKYYKEAGVWTSEIEATQNRLLKEIGATK